MDETDAITSGNVPADAVPGDDSPATCPHLDGFDPLLPEQVFDP